VDDLIFTASGVRLRRRSERADAAASG